MGVCCTQLLLSNIEPGKRAAAVIFANSGQFCNGRRVKQQVPIFSSMLLTTFTINSLRNKNWLINKKIIDRGYFHYSVCQVNLSAGCFQLRIVWFTSECPTAWLSLLRGGGAKQWNSGDPLDRTYVALWRTFNYFAIESNFFRWATISRTFSCCESHSFKLLSCCQQYTQFTHFPPFLSSHFIHSKFYKMYTFD